MSEQPANPNTVSRGDDEMVASALEAPRVLLPYLPELLADLEELGSDSDLIVQVVSDLHLPPGSSVIDLGCGKGAVSIEIAAQLGFRVVGIELFEPFVAHCREAAHEAGVGDLCEFRQGNAATLARQLRQADAVVFAALGDVLGPPSETMRVLRGNSSRGLYKCDRSAYRVRRVASERAVAETRRRGAAEAGG